LFFLLFIVSNKLWLFVNMKRPVLMYIHICYSTQCTIVCLSFFIAILFTLQCCTKKKVFRKKKRLNETILNIHTNIFIYIQVVHIDYGVCFDKGLSLKIPEIVPCRLTPLLLAVLGPTAVEGKFRSACEASLTALRKDQSLLLGQ
jgi:hypothetical protein